MQGEHLEEANSCTRLQPAEISPFKAYRSLYVPPGLTFLQLHALPTQCIYVFCVDLRANSDLCHLHHKLIGFYNQDEKRLLGL